MSHVSHHVLFKQGKAVDHRPQVLPPSFCICCSAGTSSSSTPLILFWVDLHEMESPQEMGNGAIGQEVAVHGHEVPRENRDDHGDPKIVAEAAILRRSRSDGTPAAVLDLLRRVVEVRGRGPRALRVFSHPLSFRHGDEGTGCWLAVMEGGPIFLGDRQCYVVPVAAVGERRGAVVMLPSRPQAKAAERRICDMYALVGVSTVRSIFDTLRNRTEEKR